MGKFNADLVSASFLEDTLVILYQDEQIELKGKQAIIAKEYLESLGVKVQDGNLADNILKGMSENLECLKNN